MSSKNFKKVLSQARKSAQESEHIRSLYQYSAEDKIDEIAGLSDIIGLAKKFTPNFQKMGAAVLSAFKGGAKAVWDIVKRDYQEAFEKAIADLDRRKASRARAIKMGVPEALAGVPCAFWLVELGEREITEKEAMLLIDKYIPDGQNLSNKNKNLYDILYAEIIGEAYKPTAEMIIEHWQKSLLIEAAVDEYDNRAVPDWLLSAVSGARTGDFRNSRTSRDFKDALDVGRFRDDEWLAKLVISIVLVADNNDDEKLLEMIYKEEPTDRDKDNRRELTARIEEEYIPRIIAMHAALLSEREGSDPSQDGLNKEFRGKLTGRFGRAWDRSKGDLRDWERHAQRNDKEISDIAEFADFLSGDREAADGEELRDELGIDLNMRRSDMLKAIMSADEWYETVDKAESANSERALRTIIANFQKVAQENLIKLMSPSKISDIPDANPTFKDGFQAFIEAEGEDSYLNRAHESAIQENDDEMMSRLLAQYRPSYAEAYIEELKSESDFNKMIAPNLESFKRLAEGEQYGYNSDKDPMWKKMEEILASARDQVIDSLESAIPELEKQRDKAQDEMKKILDAKAAEESDEDEAPDTSDLRV